ncbi:LPS export ABC transporter permease LptG [Sphingomonas prati]|uniref:Lipopolysaccharide export system permease protein n=1 Tax=Sphingomonas prati TaxID=1843237 RepID=A0A7W9F1H0_9SPHN|nr:LPS export ABC transporter permease LptG [Sphingomonas prati]MBB5729303.1 lipopolysaccharide export system permease protein [Sphingomonas prati]GGE78509.1 LPS export ABC transporter permease LptG [Sphingomonas prati]
MNLSFGSRTITIYMARTFLVRSVAVLAALVIVLLALDLLGESGDILAYKGNGSPELWTYASLRTPQIMSRFLPFAVLLGTLITLATLNQNSEIIAMKAASVSAHQILAPLIIASVAVAAVSFAFNDRIVTRATATLSAWQAVEYGPIPADRGIVTNVWLRDGDDLVHADTVGGRGPATVLRGITVYDRDGGILKSIVTAASAGQQGGGWVLQGAQRFDVAAGVRKPAPGYRIAQGVTPDRFTLADVHPDERSFADLNDAIGELSAAGRPTGPLRAGLWHKISGPLSAVLMPLLAGVAAFGLARSGRLFLRAVLGMALGFAYFVADNFALAMGNLGAYPPSLAAWAPFVLFLLIGEAVLIRTEE